MKYIKSYRAVNESSEWWSIVELLSMGGINFDIGLELIKASQLSKEDLDALAYRVFDHFNLIDLITRTGETWNLGREEGAVLDQLVELCSVLGQGVGVEYFKNVFANAERESNMDAGYWGEDVYPVSYSNLVGRLESVNIPSTWMKTHGERSVPIFLLGLKNHISRLVIAGIGEIPQWIEKLQALTTIHFSGPATSLPQGLTRLSKLRNLHLNLDLDRVPEWLGSMSGLSALTLMSTRLTDIPDSVLSGLNSLKRLSLGNSNISPQRGIEIAVALPECCVTIGLGIQCIQKPINNP